MRALNSVELVKMLGPNQHQEPASESRIEKMRKFLSSPLMKKKPSVLQLKTFGTPLDILLQRTPSEHSVPFVITRLCQYIQTAGLNQEGLFRISGNARSVERLRASFDRSGDAPLETEGDVPSAAALLKLFLRELPDPIIPLAAHCEFLNAVKDKEKTESVSRLADLVEKLPPVNYCILSYLSYFLRQVSDMEEQNRMSASSLGIVFGPNLFRVTEDFVGLKEQSLTNQIVTYFITDYSDIFKKQAETYAIGTHVSATSKCSMNHQVSAMVSSWPETRACSTAMMSSWSLGPLSIPTDAADDSYAPLSIVSYSSEQVNSESFALCKQSENDYSSDNHLEFSEKQTCSEYSSCTSVVSERTNTSILSASMENLSLHSEDKNQHSLYGWNREEEPESSHSVMRNDSSHYMVDALDSRVRNNVDVAVDASQLVHKDAPGLDNSQYKAVQHHSKMSVEKTEEMLKDSHKSYPRGRRRHVHHHKNRDSVEKRSHSELRASSRLQNEDEFNGNGASALSSALKSDLQYASTGSLDENSVELRHSWPAFRKCREEEDISLSPLPSQLGMFHLHLDTNLPPSPPVEQEDLVTGTGLEASSANAKQLTKKIHGLKKKIKLFEENFEKLYGYKPSHTEKCSNTTVRKMLSDLSKARQDLKNIKEDPHLWNAEESLHNKSSKSTNTQRSSGLYPSSSRAADVSVEESVQEAMEHLARHREEGKRPEILEEMNRNQLIAEKVAIQKVLLNFESVHGRPASKAHRELVRPLYDRYRLTKKLIARSASGKDPAELQPILEHETMEFGASGESSEKNTSTGASIKDTQDNQRAEKGPKIVLSPHINFHELSLSELTEELNLIRDEKHRLRKSLKDFEEQFKKEHGRKAQKEDKRGMEAQYTEYKNIKSKLKLLEALVAKHEHTS